MFTSIDEASNALQEALKQRKQNEKFGNKLPIVGIYADEWVAGLNLAASTITGYKKIIRNHIRPPNSARFGSTSSPPRGSPATTTTSKTTLQRGAGAETRDRDLDGRTVAGVRAGEDYPLRINMRARS